MAKTRMPISPSQKLGTDSPISATLLAAQLAGPRRRTAATTPAPTPMSAAIAMANTASCSVTGMAWPMELATGSPVRAERAEVAVQRVADVLEVLHRERLVQAERVPDRGQLGRVALLAGQRPGRVTRQRPHADEHDDRHQHERDHRLGQPRNEIPRPSRSSRTVGLRCSYPGSEIATRGTSDPGYGPT